MFSLVLPTFNEAENIAASIDAVCGVLRGREFEIIVADDDSPDGTAAIAERLRRPEVRVLRRTVNPGLSPAVVDAFRAARGETLGVMDADLQHDEAILPQIVDALGRHEFVIGSRAVAGGGYGEWSKLRRGGSWAAALLARTVLGVKIGDPMSGYFALRRPTFARVDGKISPQGFKIMLELFCMARPETYTEIGYTFRSRRAGESKLTTKVAGQYVQNLLDLRRRMKRA